VFKGLLDFVGLYGLLLVPAGAIVVTEHWIFPRIGLTRYWSSARGQILNWPALVAWAVGMALALGLWLTDTVHLFFLFLPVYIVTAAVYIVLAAYAGARSPIADGAGGDSGKPPGRPPGVSPGASSAAPRSERGNTVLSRLFGLGALAALGACVVMPCVVYFSDYASYQENMEWFKKWLIVPTLVYFLTGTAWQLTRKKERGAH